jgi:hypothetical protein
MTEQPRRFHLQRDRDISGVSGTGIVALGCLWPDGTASVRWLGARPSTVHWDRMDDAVAVHGHGGATRIVWTDAEEDAPAETDEERATPLDADDEVVEITPAPDDGVRIHFPEFNYLDTQVWALDVGLPAGGLRPLRDAADRYLAGAQQQPVPPPPASGRGSLRDRIARALAEDDGHSWDALHPETRQSYLDNADAAMAVVNAEQSEYEETVVGRLNELNTELARTNGRLTARVAELEQVPAGRATALTDAERKILSRAIDLVADQMATRGDEFMPDDEHALAKLSRLANEAEAAS